MVQIPEFNPYSRPALLGLTYRALAGSASAKRAPLTRRQIETGRGANTELMQQRSQLTTDLEIARQKLVQAFERAEHAGLDLQLFSEQHGDAVEIKKRGSRNKLGEREQAIEQERARLINLDALAQTDLKTMQGHAKQIAADLKRTEAGLSGQREETVALSSQLEEELAAYVLDQLASGSSEAPERALADARREVRGNLMVATLHVLYAYFTQGREAGESMQRELRSIFEQHTTPIPRVLSALFILAAGEPVSNQELGLYHCNQFDNRALYRFYQLVRVLAGHRPDEQGLDNDPFLATLWALAECLAVLRKKDGDALYPTEDLARWAIGGDNIVRLLCCHALIQQGELQQVLFVLNLDPDKLAPAGGVSEFSAELYPLIAQPTLAWPAALLEPWTAALACHALLAAEDTAPKPLMAAWSEQSFSWPKSDFYWWTLGMLKSDPGLMSRNLKGSTSELFTVAPV